MLKFTPKETVLLSLLAAIQFSHIVDFMILMPLGPQLMRIFSISPGQFSLLVASYTFTAGASGLLAALYVDRFDRKKILLSFYMGFGIGTLCCALAPNYHTLLIARSITGGFGGVLSSLILSIVSDTFAYERRGTAIGVVMASFSMASIFGVPYGLYLATLWGWHSPFFLLGGISILVALSVFFIVPKQNRHLFVRQTKPKAFIVLQNIAKTPNQQWALLLMFFMVLGHFSIIPFISPSLVANAGLSEAQLPLVYMFGGVCAMFASPIAGRLADYFGKHYVLTYSVILSTVSIFLITHLAVSPVWVILLVSSSFFIFMSGRIVPTMALITSTVRPENRAGFLAVSSSVQQFTSALAAWIAGIIIVQNGNGELLRYSVVGYLGIASSIIAIFVAWRVRSDAFDSTL